MSSIEKTRTYVHEILKNDRSGHDITHIENVVKNALEICKIEQKGNTEIVELAALLHDISDWKLMEDRKETGGEEAKKWLESIKVEPSIVKKVVEIIEGVTYYGPSSKDIELSFEGRAVRDADRLEAMGQRAVERTLAFGLVHGIDEVNEYMPNLELTDEEYKNFKRKENSFVNHFFEKLLLLKNKLETIGGKRIGIERHNYMKEYLVKYLTDLKTDKPAFSRQADELLKLISNSIYD